MEEKHPSKKNDENVPHAPGAGGDKQHPDYEKELDEYPLEKEEKVVKH